MRVVLLGEPATGKSSLLVALYGALVNRRAGDLRIVRTIDNVEFLSRGLQALCRRESVRRTALDSHEHLLVELAHGEQTVSLDLPDRSGELLAHMLDARVWDPELRRQIAAAAGALLFLRAEVIARGPAEPPLPDGPPAAWTPAQMPTDVRTVDLLQELMEERAGAFPIAVIISAWDRVGTTLVSPRAWLAEQLPLLEQFLTSNAEKLPNAVFGVSAQGEDFEGEPTVGAADPWDRAFVVAADGSRGTLAEPLLWLLDSAPR